MTASKGVKKILFKIGKILGITILSIFALLFLLPILFPDTVSNKIKSWANNSITSEMNFSKARLSFFKHFPALTLTLYDFSVNGSEPFRADTLAKAKEVSLGVDLSSIFTQTISINKIYLNEGFVHIKVDTNGHANYNIYKSSTASEEKNTDTASASLRLERIQIEKIDLQYDDRSIPINIVAKEFNYEGKGDLNKSLFDLNSAISVASFSLAYANTTYIDDKKLEGNLVTRINTKQMAFQFQRNDLKINALPVQLNGAFSFLHNGYSMDFKLKSLKSGLHDIFTSLPPEYLHWLDSTVVKGTADVYVSLAGNYIAETKEMPSLKFNMKVRDGYISNNNAPMPISNIYLDFETSIPQLNVDSFYINVDSLHFNCQKDYMNASFRMKGVTAPELHLHMKTDLDLANWNRAIGIPKLHIKGQVNGQVDVDGTFSRGVVYQGLRKVPDTIITSIPQFHLQTSYSNGEIRMDSLPESIKNIHLDLLADCPDNDIHHVKLELQNIGAEALGSYVKGYFKFYNSKIPYIDANLSSKLKLNELNQYIPMQGTEVAGALDLKGVIKGALNMKNEKWPTINVSAQIKNGLLKTNYVKESIKNIQLSANVHAQDANMSSVRVDLNPVSFSFAGEPFFLKMHLVDLNNLRYDIRSHGSLNLEKIAKVFARDNSNKITGKLYTNFSLKGRQSDVVAGRYTKLDNRGALRVENIALRSELLPQPFYLNKGVFSFDKEKMFFKRFTARYGTSSIDMNGYAQNYIGYATLPNQSLQGQFNFTSPYINVDDFMFFANSNAKNNQTSSKAQAPSGVVMLPKNIDVGLNANVRKLSYQGVLIKDIVGALSLKNTELNLDSLHMNIIGATVGMSAKYKSKSPTSATFQYHIDAKEFDIKRAYNEVPFFRDMMTSAKGAEGVIGLDYTIAGRFDKNMYPIFSSLYGQGVLSVKKVKMKGFKLLNAVSKSTGRDKIKNPDLSKIEMKSSIKNNILTIDRTKMKISVFRPRFEGQVSLDGKLNLQGRLGLPPFGLFGIPFSVVGTQENPKVRLRKGKKEDQLQGVKDEQAVDSL